MNKTNDAIKKELREQWEKACNAYLTELLRTWELDEYYGSWVGDEVGGLYDYEAELTINMTDIIYCVEHDVTEEQYREWQDYCVEAAEFGFPLPNFKSWMMGCPRTDADTFKHLRDLKERLNKAVEEESERLRNED